MVMRVMMEKMGQENHVPWTDILHCLSLTRYCKYLLHIKIYLSIIHMYDIYDCQWKIYFKGPIKGQCKKVVVIGSATTL